jgi:hypothetical protein
MHDLGTGTIHCRLLLFFFFFPFDLVVYQEDHGILQLAVKNLVVLNLSCLPSMTASPTGPGVSLGSPATPQHRQQPSRIASGISTSVSTATQNDDINVHDVAPPVSPPSPKQDPTKQDDSHAAQCTRSSSKMAAYFGPGGRFRPFRLLREDLSNLGKRYVSDWTIFNQQIVASAVYIFFTNILPGMTFANDLFIQTGRSWGTIEIVFSTGLCGIIFSV